APEVLSGELATEDPETAGDPKKFSYPPSLVGVGGGLAQVNAAQPALVELGVGDAPVVGLATRLEDLTTPGGEFTMVWPGRSQGTHMLQRSRDEPRRFAIQAHRSKRSKPMVQSALDEVPGLGNKRRQDLLKHFGSLKKIRQASLTELQQVQGIGPKLAQTIIDTLSADNATKRTG